MAPSLRWQRTARDLSSDLSSVKTTFSSWDSCMAKGYCKWPVIVAIIIGALIVLSLLSCLFRCLCCGAECCCACLSCCNGCCPSPRRRRNDGYEQPPPIYQQPPPQPYPQYQSHQGPVYASGGASGYLNAPQTATFNAPSAKTNRGGLGYNEDALPAMPGWDSAQTRHVEEQVEMESLQQPRVMQQQALLPQAQIAGYERASGQQPYDTTGDIGVMPASPYRDHGYDQHTSYMPSRDETSGPPAYPPTYQSNVYEPQSQHQQHWGSNQPYAASVAPSYHTHALSPVNPVVRKPVPGSWREV